MLWVGYLGAVAFHPDDASLVASEPLWTAFGLSVYLGALGLYVLVALAVLRIAMRGVRRLCTRGVTSNP